MNDASQRIDQQFADELKHSNQQLILFIEQDRYEQVLANQASALAWKQFGRRYPNYVASFNMLALLRQMMGNYAAVEPCCRRAKCDEAEPLFRRITALLKASLGPNYRYITTTWRNLASTLQAIRRLGEAAPFLLRSVALRQNNIDHDSVLTKELKERLEVR